MINWKLVQSQISSRFNNQLVGIPDLHLSDDDDDDDNDDDEDDGAARGGDSVNGSKKVTISPGQ